MHGVANTSDLLALQHRLRAGRQPEALASAHRLLETLSARERQVLIQVIAGRMSKQIAGDLGLVEKTIKVHRSRITAKLGVRNVVELVRFSIWAGLVPNVWPIPRAPLDHGPTVRQRPAYLA